MKEVLRHTYTPEVRDHAEIAISQVIYDQGPTDLDDHLATLESYLTDYYEHTINRHDSRPHAARLAVLADLRRCVQRVFTQQISDQLMPATLDLLDDGHRASWLDIESVVGEVEDIEEWHGARYRVFYGDEAKIAAAYERLFYEVASRLFEEYSAYDAALFVDSNHMLTNAIKDLSGEVATIEFEPSEVNDVLQSNPYIAMETQGPSMRQRLLAFRSNRDTSKRSNSGLHTDVFEQLKGNAVAFGEFYASMAGTVLPYELGKRGYSPEEILSIELANIAILGATAAVPDSVAEDILFRRRHELEWDFTKTDDQPLIMPGQTERPFRSAVTRIRKSTAMKIGQLSGETLGAWGRCPSTQHIQSIAHSVREPELLAAVDLATGGHRPEHLTNIMTSADVAAIAAVALMRQLWRRGVITLEPASLGPVERREPLEARQKYDAAQGS